MPQNIAQMSQFLTLGVTDVSVNWSLDKLQFIVSNIVIQAVI
jgi:hypothetical protein